MILGTMASAFMKNELSGHDYIDALRKLKDVGFSAMDPNMGNLHKGKLDFNRDDWESVAYDLKDEAERLGMALPQAHLPFALPITRRANATCEDGEQNEYFMAMMERSIRVASILGVKWGVVHPVNVQGELEFDREDDLKYNYEYYARYVELADKLGVGLAFENIVDVDGKRRFGVTPAELIAIINSFGTDNVGVCWDFGHANRTYKGDQTPALRKIGKYIRATHVDDNIGDRDLHTLPYLGNIRWEDVMHTLGEVGYDGSFVFEIKFTKNMPEGIKESAARLAVEVGNHLISLAKK